MPRIKYKIFQGANQMPRLLYVQLFNTYNVCLYFIRNVIEYVKNSFKSYATVFCINICLFKNKNKRKIYFMLYQVIYKPMK